MPCTAGFQLPLYPLRVNSVCSDQSRLRTYVRFAPKADQRANVSLSPLCAKTGLMQRSKKRRYSMISCA
jgi:hypothetical protein